jgi:diguanylate cyclase (GGDEF)-like protein
MLGSGTPGSRRAAFLVPILGVAIVCAALGEWSARWIINPIQTLSVRPVRTVVHLAGVVISADPSHTQFWIQDESGAIPVSLNHPDPRIHVGESVYLEGAIISTAPRVPQPGASKGSPPAAKQSGSPRSGPAAAKPENATAKTSPVPNPDSGPGAAPPVFVANAAPGVTLAVTRFEPDSYRRTLEGTVSAFWLLWLLALLLWNASQRSALRKASEAIQAVRSLSTVVRRLTREGSFDMEVPVHGDADVAPLATGINAMLAELSHRDKAKREAESRLEHWALIDDLTGLPNRRLLSDRLSQCLTKAERDQTAVGLLCMNLDDFRLVNDSLGHAAGDILLAQVAQRLKDRFRQSDTLARTGADEFAVILDKIQSRQDAQTAAESLQELLKTPFDINGHEVQVSASIGLSLYPNRNERGQLLQQADCAMYAAKRNGKGRIVQFSDQLASATRERLTLEGELQHALARGEISVVYQPEYDLATNAIVRFEALARWTHPEIGLIQPMSFIPVAEEKGLIIPLGAHVMEKACTEAVAWQEIAGRPIQVAVNVSTVQFSRDSFLEEVADILRRTGLHPSLLQIELTESATVAGIERAAEMMNRLKRMGISIAVDDFGTGYSCLSYLPKLNFDFVKLDRSFVSEMMERRETRSFVKSILELAHDLHMKVIAEGVETRQQLSLVKSLGTDEAQGFLLGRPSNDPHVRLREERGPEPARVTLAESHGAIA